MYPAADTGTFQNGKMKKKQLIGIIVTAIVIIAVGVTGVVSNVLANAVLEKEEGKAVSWWEEIMESGSSEITIPDDDFIGVLNIVGTIQETSSGSISSSDAYNHSMCMDYIEEMEESEGNKGILLYVDSPGGAVYQSDELYLKLMEYKEKTKRPVWAYFASEACSGGYYISMAADKIYANRNAWTGSIGVIISLTNCKDLYEKLGIREIDITSGKNKAMGSAGLDLTDEQYDILQSLVDESYDQFVGIVSDGRNLDESTVRKLADGRIYSAKQAKEKMLIDEISSLEETKQVFAKELGCSKDVEFYAPKSKVSDFFSLLFSKAEKIVPKSDLSLAKDIMENNGNGVLMYYAK